MRLRLFHLTLLLVFSATVNYRFFANVSGVLSVTLLEVTALLSMFAVAGMLVTRPALGQQVYRVIRGNLLVFAYFGWIIFTALANLTWGTTVPAEVLKDLLPGILIFFFVVLTVRGIDEVRAILAAYLLGAMVQAALGEAQVLFGGPRLVPLAEMVEYKRDIGGALVDIGSVPTGLSMHPNGLALHLVPAILLLLAQLCYGHYSLHRRLVIILCLALSLTVLWHTQGKGAMAWMVIGIGIVFVPAALARWWGWISWTALVAGILSISLVSLWLHQEMGQLGTVISRIQLAEAALAVLVDYPVVLAIGGGNEAMFGYSGLYSNMVYPSAHNTYLDLALMFGLPGLFLYLGFVKMALGRLSFVVQGKASVELMMIRRFLYAALISQLGIFYFEPALAGQYQSPFLLLVALGASTTAWAEGTAGRMRGTR